MKVNVMELAAAEAVAAERRTVAEADWRERWWGTTEGLAELPTAGVGEQLECVARVLGGSTRWMSQRRTLGGRIDPALRGSKLLAKVPPRLAVEYARANRVLDPEAATFLIQWEAAEKSLRELATELGTAGRSWATKEQLDERDAAAKPTVEQIRAALADPRTAREVVAHGPTRAAFQGATDSWAREATKDTRWAPLPPNMVTADRIGQFRAEIMRARELLHGVRIGLADIALDGEQLETLDALVADVGDEAILLRDLLSGQARFAADVAQIGVNR